MVYKFFVFLLLLESQISFSQNVPDSVRSAFYAKYMDSVAAQMLGKKFPAFSMNKRTVPVTSDKDLQNKVVYVNFWFAACSPCMAEMKALNKLYDTLKGNRDFVFLSITFDPESTVETVVKKFGIKYPIISVSQAETKRLNFQSGYPTSFILDRRGIVRYYTCGGPIDEDDATDEIMASLYPKIIKQLLADDHESE